MCRLYGSRSQLPSPAQGHLARVKNSLQVQSREHKDGWGIAHYDDERLPRVVHGISPAHADPEFERNCQLLSSRAIIAHVRLASVGPVHPLNAHPFTFGRWTFAHNGTVRDFQVNCGAIEAQLAPRFRGLLKGDTDSERCFYLFLTYLDAISDLGGRVSAQEVARALARVTFSIAALTDKPDAEKPSTLNFLVTDGELMVATRHKKELYFSECRGTGGQVATPLSGSRLERLVIASEELSAEDAWFPLAESSAVAVDDAMTLSLWPLAELA